VGELERDSEGKFVKNLNSSEEQAEVARSGGVVGRLSKALEEATLRVKANPEDEAARDALFVARTKALARIASRGASGAQRALDALAQDAGELLAPQEMRAPREGQVCSLCHRPHKLKLPLCAEAVLAMGRLFEDMAMGELLLQGLPIPERELVSNEELMKSALKSRQAGPDGSLLFFDESASGQVAKGFSRGNFIMGIGD